MNNSDGTRTIKLENPVPIRPTMVVLDENEDTIGDTVEIALKARDSWLELLGRCGFTFQKHSRGFRDKSYNSSPDCSEEITLKPSP